jgi:cell division septum initiation protein DivIVA
MSAVEQGAVSRSEVQIDIPEFPVGMRGYDRQQVDIFVRDLLVRLTAERRRVEHSDRTAAQMRAELASLRNQPPPSFEHLGSEAARVLEQAGLSAKLLMEEARNRGQALVEEAEVQATELIERAERRAADLEGEARGTLETAAGQRDRILSEARHAVDEVRGEAEEGARTALGEARAAADDMRRTAAAEQASMRAQTERLRASREHMLEYLGRIHDDIGALLGEAVRGDAATNGSVTAPDGMEAVDADPV